VGLSFPLSYGPHLIEEITGLIRTCFSLHSFHLSIDCNQLMKRKEKMSVTAKQSFLFQNIFSFINQLQLIEEKMERE
jgi:hypothetical protein